jgi:hypothetical protein
MASGIRDRSSFTFERVSALLIGALLALVLVDQLPLSVPRWGRGAVIILTIIVASQLPRVWRWRMSHRRKWQLR